MSQSAARKAARTARAEKADADRMRLSEVGFAAGQKVKVDGEGTAVFTVVGASSDGALTCTSDSGGAFRSFRPEWCYPATRVNRRGRTVPSNCPPEIRGRRRAWRAEHGFGMVQDR